MATTPNGKSSILTKDHFDQRMDALTKEIQDMREEQTLHQGQHEEIVDRLDRLEKQTGLPPIYSQ